jgi:uncharacterized delta-60 repeat protein
VKRFKVSGLLIAMFSTFVIIFSGCGVFSNDPSPTPAPANTPGSLDATFGTGGKVTTAIGTRENYAYSVVIQSDGKIVAAGHSSNGSNYDFALARYNADGSLDTTFGTGGTVTTAIGTGNDYVYSVAIQSDRKIVVAGSAGYGSHDDFALARYNADGSLDTTFGTGGKVTTAIGMWASAHSIAIQSDGKIVAAGLSAANSSSYYDFALVRYNADGSLDTTFDTDGIVTTAIGAYHDEAYSVAVQSDGKIIAAGRSSDSTNSNAGFALVRYNADGSLDTTFGTGGKVTTAIGTGNDYANSVAIQSGGKIVAAGHSYNGSNYDFALVRYNADGSLDTTFGTSGKVTTAIGTGDDYANSIAVQSGGKIVAAGYSNNGSTSDFALARYNADGSLDATFGTGGKVTTAIGTWNYANSVAIQSDGKIIAAGSSSVSTSDFALARYWQ